MQRRTGSSTREHHPPYPGPSHRPLSHRPEDRGRRPRPAALFGCSCNFRPWQRHLPRLRARRGPGQTADLSRPERTIHGAGRGRLRAGPAAQANSCLLIFDRSWLHQYAHSRWRRPLRPPARPLSLRRQFCDALSRSSPTAGRTRSRSDNHGKRRLQGRLRLFRPDFPARTDSLLAAAGRRAHARPSLMRAGDAVARPGCSRGRLRLSPHLFRRAGPSHSALSRRRRPDRISGRHHQIGAEAADHRRRRRPLFRGMRGTCGVF